MTWKHWSPALLFVGLVSLAAVPWHRFLWTQFESDHESAYANCGYDGKDYPGHLEMNINFMPLSGMSVVFTNCHKRKASSPRAADYLILGIGVQ